MIAFIHGAKYKIEQDFTSTLLTKNKNMTPMNVALRNLNKTKLSSRNDGDKDDLMFKKEENLDKSKMNILDFLQDVKDEIKMVEWPTIDRLSKQFVIVVMSLVFSALFIFSIDGLFASASKYLFEGK